MTLLIGAHAPTQGWTERAKAAAIAMQARCYLWLESEGPQDAIWVDQNIGPSVHILRCRNWRTDMSTALYVALISPLVRKWQAMIPNLILQLGNEPDLESDHHGEAIQQYADAVRAFFPGILVGNPPLSVGNSNLAIFRGCDVRLMHSYFERQYPESMTYQALGASYRWALVGAEKKVCYVTEFNVVQTNCPIDWADRNRQAAAWLDQAEADGVAGVALFILDGQNEWASFDVGPEAAQEILALRHPAPVPPPEDTVPDYLHFRPLSWTQYENIIESGTIPGFASPMHTLVDYDALIGVMTDAQIDPRLPLAFTWSEGHHGSDPGLVAAAYNNLGGIKYVGAPGSYDTGVAADTGGTYAGFYDLRPYYVEWARIMQNDIIGPDFRAGNLIGAVEHYTNGPGTGWNKVSKYKEYVSDYPVSGPMPPPPPDPKPLPTGIIGEMIATEALTQNGATRSGTYDTHNGDHIWYLWCQSFVERVHEHAGVTGGFYASAADCGRAMEALGLLHRGDTNAPRGSVLFWDEAFWADGGHTAISLGDGTFIGTTDTGIKVRDGWQASNGYMGWAYRPGVGDIAEDDTLFTVDGKIDDGRLDAVWFGTDAPTITARKTMPRVKGHGIPDRWEAEFRAGKGLGKVTTREKKADASGAIIQYFQNGWVVSYPDGSTSVN